MKTFRTVAQQQQTTDHLRRQARTRADYRANAIDEQKHTMAFLVNDANRQAKLLICLMPKGLKRMPTCAKIDWIRIRTRIAKVVLSILGLLLLAAFNDNGSSSAPTPRSTVVPMDAKAWSILYSPGMPPHPAPQPGGGWYFDFPTEPNSVHYVLAAVNMAASSYVDASILVTTSGTPVFVYNLEPHNTCVYPAQVRFLLQEKGDDLSGRNGKQYFRWWSNSVAYQLASGASNLRASLTDLSQWTSVFGEKANASPTATAGFQQAIANLGSVGFSFGGGCFYGHGVRVSGGGARFAITNYAVK